MTIQNKQHSDSRRAQECEAMIKKALARPGVRDVMEVYRGWQEKDRGLHAYRSAGKAARRVTASNSSNPQRPEV